MTARSDSAAAVITAAVSPRIRSATAKPATWTGVHAPVRIASKAARIVSGDAPSLETISSKTRGKGMTGLATVSPVQSVSQRADPVPQEIHARRRQDRLRVELDALDRVLAVAQAHHLALGRPGADLEARRERRSLDDERVVTRGHERQRQAG